jgi:ribonuclease VapC
VSRAVLDASALLALLFKEPGAQAVIGHLPGSLMSAVNLSEVVGKSVDTGLTVEQARSVLSAFPCEIVPFDGESAYLAAAMRASTRAHGLSLGDRACLALGQKTGWPVVTADRKWTECDIGMPIIQIR